MSQQTAYQAAKTINAKLKAEGIDKTLPPQMFYTYIKKAYIPSTLCEDGKRRVSLEDLSKWYEGYSTNLKAKMQRKAAIASMEAEEAEFNASKVEASPEEIVEA
jgi:hypothetical protein